MDPLTLSDGIIVGLKKTLGTKIAEVALVEGEFSPEEIAATYQRGPLSLVLRLDGNQLSTEEARLRWLPFTAELFLVAKAATAKARMEALLPILSLSLRTVLNNTWGVECAQAPSDIGFENATSDELIHRGLSIWMIHWKQPLDLGEIPIDDIAALEAIEVDYHFAADDQNEAPRAQDTIIIPLSGE